MDYDEIRKLCAAQSRISEQAIDEFIMHYAAAKDQVDKEFDQRIKKFNHLNARLPRSLINRLKAQYIVHRIFKDGGLIKKYLNHSEVKSQSPDIKNFLANESRTPWRFSFSYLIGNPATDFYEMVDVFSEEKFILYSRGITDILATNDVMLWFNLIGFNGQCWQSYGPIMPFKSFDHDDIYFFATELDMAIENENDVQRNIENNAVPYMMLLSNADLPPVIAQGCELIYLQATYDALEFPGEKAKTDFNVEYSDGIYRAKLKAWGVMPHLATLYFSEEDKELQLSAMTDDGFIALVAATRKLGYPVESEVMLKLHLTMHSTIELILRKKVELFPFDDAFDDQPDDENDEMMSKLNLVLKWALPEVNAGREPDLKAMAKKANLDFELAREVLENAIARARKLRDR